MGRFVGVGGGAFGVGVGRSVTELAVLVPVLGRPQNVQPLVESFLAGCPAGTELWFICSADDTAEIEAVRQLDIPGVDWMCGGGTWPEKINVGTSRVAADWYLCAADDVRFTEGWWDATARLRADHAVGVIGTNDSATDQGNPRVAAGEHTCHPLIRADYIRDHGTVDHPGLAVHPGYHHWFVDDELVWTARSRGAWAYCQEAVIEHLHPYWGTADMDDTYRLGEANSAADAELWRKRAPLLGLTVT